MFYHSWLFTGNGVKYHNGGFRKLISLLERGCLQDSVRKLKVSLLRNSAQSSTLIKQSLSCSRAHILITHTVLSLVNHPIVKEVILFNNTKLVKWRVFILQVCSRLIHALIEQSLTLI